MNDAAGRLRKKLANLNRKMHWSVKGDEPWFWEMHSRWRETFHEFEAELNRKNTKKS